MAIQPLPAHGTLNWDIPLNSILGQLGNHWYPSDQGFLAWSLEPSQAANASPVVSGTVYMMAVPLRQTATISTITMAVATTAGSGLVSNQNFAGVYNSAGTRLGVTADQSVNWTSVGAKIMPLTAPIASAPAGMYYVAFVSNGTTPPNFTRESSSQNNGLNANLTAATFRSSLGPTSQTSLPASITMASRTSGGAAGEIAWFTALS
jgi:hypothetical protein